MSTDFLTPGLAEPDATWRSPLERALRDAPADVHDLSRAGKLEVRGDAAATPVLEVEGVTQAFDITPQRALLLCDEERIQEIQQACRNAGLFVVDLTAALAGLRFTGRTAMRRLTDLDLDRLPAVGQVARVRTYVFGEDETFSIYFPQEYGDYLTAAVLDALEGVR